LSTEPETAATEAVSSPPGDLSAAASPAAEAVSAPARADGGAAAEGQLPGPEPEGSSSAPDGAGPGIREGTRADMAALYERITSRQAPAAPLVSWAPLWAEFDAAEAANARGEREDGRSLDQQYEAAWHRVFGPPPLAASEQASA